MASRGLSAHQRLVTNIEIEVPGKELEKHRKGELIVLVQLTDKTGHRFRSGTVLDLKGDSADAKRTDTVFLWSAFTVPGEYKATLILHSTATGEHNLKEHELHVHPLKHDALPGVWDGLPSVEFLEEDSELDRFYRPEVQDKERLELITRRPVKVEVVADVTTSEMFHGSQRFFDRYLSYLLPTLKVLSQIHVQNGVLDIAAVDRAGRAVFQQDKVDELDWDRLKEAMTGSIPSKVDVQELRERTGPLFLRKEVMRRA
ncbi:MAG TPA: hypothetical protein VEW69_11925, partial [Alphaproteobacteria bacterium]|nr:hypothetical protein [Alphaproteobacteria bacterium]